MKDTLDRDLNKIGSISSNLLEILEFFRASQMACRNHDALSIYYMFSKITNSNQTSCLTKIHQHPFLVRYDFIIYNAFDILSDKAEFLIARANEKDMNGSKIICKHVYFMPKAKKK